MRIVYIGNKEQKGDNVAHTGLIWTPGQIHTVEDEKKAEKLLEHSHVWADADRPYEMIKPLALASTEPKVTFIADGEPLLDPVTIVLPLDVFKKLQSNELAPVFMTSESAESFEVWKKLQTDTAPKNTGPKKQDKETKAGLEGKKAA